VNLAVVKPRCLICLPGSSRPILANCSGEISGCVATVQQPVLRIATRASFLGVVYQAYYLVPELDVLENVLLPARISGNLNQAVKERAQQLLDQMGVADKARQIPGKLSGGERQRVAIARALINQPKVLLADEPTGNLDERTGVDVMNLLLRTCSNEGASLVLVTHNPSFAQSTDRQLFLSEGQMNEV